jgi:hypothetical protein
VPLCWRGRYVFGPGRSPGRPASAGRLTGRELATTDPTITDNDDQGGRPHEVALRDSSSAHVSELRDESPVEGDVAQTPWGLAEDAPADSAADDSPDDECDVVDEDGLPFVELSLDATNAPDNGGALQASSEPPLPAGALDSIEPPVAPVIQQHLPPDELLHDLVVREAAPEGAQVADEPASARVDASEPVPVVVSSELTPEPVSEAELVPQPDSPSIAVLADADARPDAPQLDEFNMNVDAVPDDAMVPMVASDIKATVPVTAERLPPASAPPPNFDQPVDQTRHAAAAEFFVVDDTADSDGEDDDDNIVAYADASTPVEEEFLDAEADEIDPEPELVGSAPVAGGMWTIPMLCLGIAIIACCILIPQADYNRRLVYEREKLRRDAEAITEQVKVNDEFLHKLADDASLAERLAQRQMKIVRQGTRVLDLKSRGYEEAEMSPFQLVTVPPPEPLPPFQPRGGALTQACLNPHTRLYLIGGALILMASGLVLGYAPRRR